MVRQCEESAFPLTLTCPQTRDGPRGICLLYKSSKSIYVLTFHRGVFLCIRCSGIHRSMGTHISRVKSVDLDLWTPEQMDSIQKWGNARANAYWEAHLKQGHIPPEQCVLCSTFNASLTSSQQD